MPAKGFKHTPEARERIKYGTRRALAQRRERLRTRARDVSLLRSGRVPVSQAVLPHLEAAEAELAGFLEALGGADVVTAQRRAILEDVCRLGVALRSELARYAETRDPDCASRLSSLATARRAALSAVGLDEHRVELTLQDYLRQRDAELQSERQAQEAAQRANASAPDAQPPGAGDRPGERQDEALPGPEVLDADDAREAEPEPAEGGHA